MRDSGVCFLYIAVILLLLSSGQGSAAEISLGPEADTMVIQGRNTNFGYSPQAKVQGSNPEKIYYLRFIIDAPVKRAILKLTCFSNPDGLGVIVRKVEDNSWQEDAMVYGTRPVLGEEIARSRIPILQYGDRTVVKLDLSGDIQVPGIYSIALTTTESSQGDLVFDTKESLEGGPVLVVFTGNSPRI